MLRIQSRGDNNILLRCVYFAAIWLCFAGQQPLLAQTTKTEIKLLHAAREMAAESPLRVNISQSQQVKSMLVVLDNTDVTQLIQVDSQGFSYVPVMPLSSGAHQLLVALTLQSGRMLQRDFSFTVEQRPQQQSTASNAVMHGQLEVGSLVKDNDYAVTQDYRVRANFNHENTWQGQQWQGQFQTELWYFNQGFDQGLLEDKRVELIDYRYRLERSLGDRQQFGLELGDLSINSSPITAWRLSRRGLSLELDTENTHSQIFSVSSNPEIGSHGNAGFGSSNKETIAGVQSSVTFLDNAVSVQAHYLNGATDDADFTLPGAAVAQRGDVAGLMVDFSWGGQKQLLQFEYNQAEFDTDTSDTLEAEEDDAYAVRFDGRTKNLRYELEYQHIGRDYQVVSNPLLRNDQESLSAALNYFPGYHALNLSALQLQDNIENDPTRVSLEHDTAVLDYHYNRLSWLAFGVNLQSSTVNSRDEPLITDRQRFSNQSTSFNVSSYLGRWQLAAAVGNSEQDDELQSFSERDTEIDNTTMSVGWQAGNYHFNMQHHVNDIEFMQDGRTTRNTLSALNMNGLAFGEKFEFDLSASKSKQRSISRDSHLNGRLRMAYRFEPYGGQSPLMRVGLEAEHIEDAGQVINQQGLLPLDDGRQRKWWLFFSIEH